MKQTVRWVPTDGKVISLVSPCSYLQTGTTSFGVSHGTMVATQKKLTHSSSSVQVREKILGALQYCVLLAPNWTNRVLK